ncbi:MAG: hypothetical protein Fur0032_01060 [Terrimicrobiaceae bacterium]
MALVREGFPDSEIEVMGYQRVLPLVEGRPYADKTCGIDYAPMAACFNPAARMEPGLEDYFRSFGQIISYLYDPDKLFERSLRAVGVKNFLPAVGKLTDDGPHATEQLAAPLTSLALFLTDPIPRLHFEARELEESRPSLPGRVVALHPGSGSPRKNWPVGQWKALAAWLLAEQLADALVVVGGEADEQVLDEFRRELRGQPVKILYGLPLRRLAATLAGCRLMIGHDSGISHLAAAAGCPVIALFGPTDPAVWSPRGQRVRVLGGLLKDWAELPLAGVQQAVREELTT